MAKRVQHDLARWLEAASAEEERLEKVLDDYLADGLMPLERPTTPEEQLEGWQSLPPEELAARMGQSPREFLRWWDAMRKLEARQKSPLTPYLAPYGLPVPEEGPEMGGY